MLSQLYLIETLSMDSRLRGNDDDGFTVNYKKTSSHKLQRERPCLQKY